MRNDVSLAGNVDLTLSQMFEISFTYTKSTFLVLFLTYLLIGVITQKTTIINKAKKSPIVWSFLGSIPQCGFSAVCADLYNKKMMMTGTLISVFISTSDEFLPIVLSGGEKYTELFFIIGIKLIFGISLGTLLNKTFFKNEDLHETEAIEQCHSNIFVYAFRKTLTVVTWIFISSFTLEIILKYVDKSAIESILRTDTIFHIFLIGAFSLIPNCCVSIIISKLYLTGIITVGATVTALSCASGFGYVFLFKKSPKQGLKIISITYISAVCLGIIVDFLL